MYWCLSYDLGLPLGALLELLGHSLPRTGFTSVLPHSGGATAAQDRGMAQLARGYR